LAVPVFSSLIRLSEAPSQPALRAKSLHPNKLPAGGFLPHVLSLRVLALLVMPPRTLPLRKHWLKNDWYCYIPTLPARYCPALGCLTWEVHPTFAAPLVERLQVSIRAWRWQWQWSRLPRSHLSPWLRYEVWAISARRISQSVPTLPFGDTGSVFSLFFFLFAYVHVCMCPWTLSRDLSFCSPAPNWTDRRGSIQSRGRKKEKKNGEDDGARKGQADKMNQGASVETSRRESPAAALRIGWLDDPTTDDVSWTHGWLGYPPSFPLVPAIGDNNALRA